MKYRKDRFGNELSQLGFGCMRFEKTGPYIDYKKAESLVMYAIDQGVNYFDTAYMYLGSEECLGRILDENHARDKVSIATKLPQYLVKNLKDADRIFEEELKRLRTDHVDYYLMHMFTDYAEWERLKDMGIEQWFEDRKAEGQVRQTGFSFHGDTGMFLKILDAYDWDFSQIQYNYIDEVSQAGRIGLETAAAKGIPVIIMEPLRGGKLVNLLPPRAKELIGESRPGWSPAELGLKWLWDQKDVTVVLSGMNSMDMLKENIRIASETDAGSFSESDYALVGEVIKCIREKEKVGCTACRYCMPCPQGVDIPGTFHYYNLMHIEKKTRSRIEYIMGIGLQKDAGFASRCIGCGKCEKHCPQHIQIREKLKEADRALRPLPFRIGTAVARTVFRMK